MTRAAAPVTLLSLLSLLCGCAATPPIVQAPVAAAATVKCDGEPFAGGSCEPIRYTSEACAKVSWFGSQPLLDTLRVCLGVPAPPSGKTCTESPDNVECYLDRHPRSCNFLALPGITPCQEELFMTCLEHADLGGGRPVWVSRPATVIAQLPATGNVASEICHWQRARQSMPVVSE